MKTSIFDMNVILPPMIEMTEVMKEMPMEPRTVILDPFGGWC